MPSTYVTAPLSGPSVDSFEELSKVLATAEESSDGKRIVVLGAVPMDLLAEHTAKREGKAERPYAVHAVRLDGTHRTWLLPTRDAARKLTKAYRENDGSAVIQDTRKSVAE